MPVLTSNLRRDIAVVAPVGGCGKSARSVLPLRVVLRVLRLSQSRYHSWKRQDECCFDDAPSCPRTSPQQLTQAEVNTIKEMVTSEAYRHVPTGTLALLPQRLGKVSASQTTWYRFVRLNKWRRPRGRIHPSKPKIGIRALGPNEIWHVDTTLIRLLDGSRAYLHAVIDNSSRRILAWTVSATFDPSTTPDSPIRLSVVKHRMRCTSTPVTTFPRNLRRPGKPHANRERRSIARHRVRHASS